jgi:hypothetical protein
VQRQCRNTAARTARTRAADRALMQLHDFGFNWQPARFSGFAIAIEDLGF